MSHMMRRAFKFKLKPTAEQELLLRQTAGVVRLVYNLALEQRSDWWRQYKASTGSGISFYSQCHELTALRAEVDWISAVSHVCQAQALKDLDGAFSRFFKGSGGYPTPRKKGVNDGFRFLGRDCRVAKIDKKHAFVFIPKIGLIRFRLTRKLAWAKLLNVTVSQDALGWHVSFACEVERPVPLGLTQPVGIDRGVARSLSFSDGAFADLPLERMRAIERRRQRAQRVVSRRKKSSANRRKAIRRVASLSAQIARIRLHWQHVQAKRIADTYGFVALEKLRASSMTRSAKGNVEAPGQNVRQKAGLNRSILNQGWHQFQTILAYKLDATGGTLALVDPAFTSQTCSDCGVVHKLSRKSQAVFACIDCGFTKNADTNAAINIERRGNFPLLPVDAAEVSTSLAAVEAGNVSSANAAETFKYANEDTST